MSPATAPFWTRFRRDRSGLALLEFALTMPLVFVAGGYGAELSYYALCQLKVSQYALNLADNASRVGQVASNGISTLRETDLNDVLEATRRQGDAIGLTTYGRVTLSSLEKVTQDYDKSPTQRIHWQRCIGVHPDDPKDPTNKYDSSYGGPSKANLVTAGTTAPNNWTASSDDKYAGVSVTDGMGDTNAKVTAPADSGIMFVEINYEYHPLFSDSDGANGIFMKKTKIHYIASLIVRDSRDFSQITNPSPRATASTCDLHTKAPVTLNAY